MMGKGSAVLRLTVAAISDRGTAERIRAALLKVAGVKRVLTDPHRHLATVEFAAQGNATTEELLAAITGTGVSATPEKSNPREASSN